MRPEPIAWIYQNANTEHQYLVWHKQTGGRNWTPLFTLRDVQEAVLAEREACAAICDSFQARDVGMQPAECAGAIRARSNK